MEKANPWPLNMNALGAVVGVFYIAFFGDTTRSAAVGLGICMIWCTSQICQTIRERR